jgi:hypothetical protein
MPKGGLYPLEYLCTKWNTYSRYPGLVDDRRAAFSIVLVGNQIDASMFVKAFFDGDFRRVDGCC